MIVGTQHMVVPLVFYYSSVISGQVPYKDRRAADDDDDI
jgi:hypothetical protein